MMSEDKSVRLPVTDTGTPPDLLQLVKDVDEIRGAYGYLLMQVALSEDAFSFNVGKKEEATHREAFARLEQLLSRPGLSNHESWAAMVSEIRKSVASNTATRPDQPRVQTMRDGVLVDCSVSELIADAEVMAGARSDSDAAMLLLLAEALRAATRLDPHPKDGE
jgi:hypothetical protein